MSSSNPTKGTTEATNASGMELKDEIMVLLKGAGEKGLLRDEISRPINLARKGAGNKLSIIAIQATLDESVSNGTFLKVGERYFDPDAQAESVSQKQKAETEELAKAKEQISKVMQELEVTKASLQRSESLRGTDAKRIESLETRLTQSRTALELSCKDAEEARKAIITLESMLDAKKLEIEGLQKQLGEAKGKPMGRSEEVPPIVPTQNTLKKSGLVERVAIAIAIVVCAITGWYALTF